MKSFWIVLRFEIMNFVKNKSFIIATGILCGLLIIGLSLPTIRDTFFSSDTGEEQEETGEEFTSDERYGVMDLTDGRVDVEVLQESFWRGSLEVYSSEEEMKEAVSSGELEAGYVIRTETGYDHVMRNNEMMGTTHQAFEDSLRRAYRIQSFEERGLDFREVEEVIHAPIQRETVILGTDSVSNYIYTYVLVFGLYFIIIVYGQVVATNVASEKSNRAMEVLVTSTKTRYLIFGKVLGGALAGAGQMAVIIATARIAYTLNRGAWNEQLDFVFDIPLETLGSFAAFGILGYLFYLFIFGALGALVSRTEDVSTSVTPITIIFVVVFFIAVMGMQNTEGMMLRVASFVPFSSFMAMFVRVSMGSVEAWEVAASLAILIVTTLVTGWLASKIYRMGTLMYGNPVKITKVVKLLFSEDV